MDDATRKQLRQARAAIEVLNSFESQSQGYTTDMAFVMLTDMIEGDGLRPIRLYVDRYCDVVDSPADAERITAEIEAGAE